MKHFKTIFAMAFLTLVFSCTKSHTQGNGHVSFVLSSDIEIAEQTKSSVSQYTTLPSSGDFTITVTGVSSVYEWTGKISDWDAAAQLPVGNYKVTATYGAIDEEGFDKPYFIGSADFAVLGAQTTEVKISVSLGNTVVLVNCTDNFKNYYKDYTFKITRDGSTLVSFVKGESRAAFVDGYKFTLQGVIESETKTQTFSRDYSSLDEATAYTFLFDAPNVGGSAITITFNNNVETIELGDLELNE